MGWRWHSLYYSYKLRRWLARKFLSARIMIGNVKYAFLSGLFAATASTFAKLSGLSTLQELFFLRVIFFIAMAACNAAMLTFFVKALQRPITISSATNYVFSVGHNINFLAFTTLC
ncbi:hypothetical protein JTB14_012266 [Gonioctena quinquepunctata]|nr:hypothetical protein JTB14_012266 [Gonioctena quinquepunctata]